jgi:hypothetical protein
MLHTIDELAAKARAGKWTGAQRAVAVCLDSMKCRGSVVFNLHTGEFVGMDDPEDLQAVLLEYESWLAREKRPKLSLATDYFAVYVSSLGLPKGQRFSYPISRYMTTAAKTATVWGIVNTTVRGLGSVGLQTAFVTLDGPVPLLTLPAVSFPHTTVP